MANITVKVGSSVGLHARPAAIIAKAAAELGTPVTLKTEGGNPVNAASSLFLMTLGAKFGDEIVVSSDDDAAAQKIADIVATDWDAPDAPQA
ncbi:HPr family phosphocarrier protein [Micrococcales bacterium 31B]|nr:HPr family phosphocarrier protein [Micrococcales bacterium 31B]